MIGKFKLFFDNFFVIFEEVEDQKRGSVGFVLWVKGKPDLAELEREGAAARKSSQDIITVLFAYTLRPMLVQSLPRSARLFLCFVSFCTYPVPPFEEKGWI